MNLSTSDCFMPVLSMLRSKIVKNIDMLGIDMVFVVGGNGGNAGANAIKNKCEEQSVTCSVIGIPKSIDNDILLVNSHAAVH